MATEVLQCFWEIRKDNEDNVSQILAPIALELYQKWEAKRIVEKEKYKVKLTEYAARTLRTAIGWYWDFMDITLDPYRRSNLSELTHLIDKQLVG